MEKKNRQYLAALREAMKDHGIDAVIISSTDPHQSELPPAHWRGREWLTGFFSENGTNGTAVVAYQPWSGQTPAISSRPSSSSATLVSQ